MKKILIVVFVAGIIAGAVRWNNQYGVLQNPDAFRSLDVTGTRRVVRDMLARKKFSDVLVLLRTVYPGEEPGAHGIGHILGEEAYRRYGTKAFALCDAIFNFGCYHGVVDMATRTNGAAAGLAEELFGACRQTMKDASPCIHPLGHAAAIVSGYATLDAFALCDKLYPDPKTAFSCWNGVMMEEINRSAPGAPKTVYGDPDDPYYPCKTFPEKYRPSCVSQHVAYLASVWNNDFIKLRAYCGSFVNDETAVACFDGLGAIAAQTYFTSPAMVRTACGAIPACMIGAAVPFTAARQKTIAIGLCNAIGEAGQRAVCIDRVNQLTAQYE